MVDPKRFYPIYGIVPESPPSPPGDGHGSPVPPCGMGGGLWVGMIDFDEGRNLCKYWNLWYL